MATITTDTYLDGGTARTAGEAWTCNGGRLTIRTDSRWHADKPTGMTGSLAALTISATLRGGYTIDGRNVRWLPFDTGTGNVPAIGTSIVGGTSGATGYLLGVYANLTSAPTAVGAAMPASGFIKLREVSGGNYQPEALTGIGANATGADVTGWIEVVHDQAIAITVPRLGDFTVRGDWFYLDDTTGSANQTLQVPTNGGGAGTHVPGVWIEDGVLVGAFQDDGGTFTDYTAAANQDTTGDVQLLPATPADDDAFYFGFDRAIFRGLQILMSTAGVGTWNVDWEYWNGTAWNTLSATDNTSGFQAAAGWRDVTWADPGDWAQNTVNGRTAYWVRARVYGYGGVTTQPLATKAGVNDTGVYTLFPGLVASIMSTTNLGVDPRSQFVCSAGSGQAIIGHNGTTAVGYVPVPGLKTRVPNVFLRQTSSANRALNLTPHATLASRPDFTTTSAGTIDVEYALSDWYTLFAQPYAVKLNHFATFDTVNISECATALDLEDGGTGMYGSLDVNSLLLTSNFAGGNITDWRGERGNAPGSSDHDIYLLYCIGQTLTRVQGGIIGFARSTGYAIYAAQCQNLTFNDCYVKNIGMYLLTCKNVTVDGLDYCDRYVGATNTTGTLYCINIYTACDTVTVRDITFGLKGTIANVHPYGGLAAVSVSSNIKIRECGTRAAMLNGGTANNTAYVINDAGNNNTCKFQRLYLQPTRTAPIATLNSSTKMTYESVFGDFADTNTLASLNTAFKGGSNTNTTTGQASVYGTHFNDGFTSATVGRVVLALNESTAETASLVTLSGDAKFTSAGGCSMPTLNDSVIVEMDYFAKGHTAFQNAAATLTGTNTGNMTYEYQIDVNDGNGWNGSWLTLNGANLSAETIDPALGFKLKIRITTATAATTNLISFVRILTDSTQADQEANLYDLDQYTLTLTGLQTGTKIAFLEAGTETLLTDVVSESGGEASYTFPDVDVGDSIDIAILAPGYLYQRIESYTLTAADAEIPVVQATDYGYDAGASADCTFNGSTKRVVMDAASTELNVVGMYSDWVDWALTGNNLAYDALCEQVGGNTIDSGAGTEIPVYVFLANSWRIAPDEDDHTLAVTTGIVLVSGGGDPFVDTAGAYTVRINYQQPVQAITIVSGSGVLPGDITDIADAVWDEATADHNDAGTFGSTNQRRRV